jgi:hypothetical protein
MRFYVDDKLSHEVSMKQSFGSMYSRQGQPFDQRFHLILNNAVGGNFFGGNYGSFDINRAAPTWTQPFRIDYVRVYKWSDTPIPPPVAPAPQAPLPDLEPMPQPGAPVVGGPAVVFAVADTTVDARFPSVPFGNDVTLRVARSTDSDEATQLAYLMFNIDPKGSYPRTVLHDSMY